MVDINKTINDASAKVVKETNRVADQINKAANSVNDSVKPISEAVGNVALAVENAKVVVVGIFGLLKSLVLSVKDGVVATIGLFKKKPE